MTYENSLRFAQRMDREDPLRHWQQAFYIPRHNGKKCIYLTGNSLGLQPKGTAAALQQELTDWRTYGVEGHFKAKHPWFGYHHRFTRSLCRLVGARPAEVVAMNQLTVNLNLLLISFYRPTKRKNKILIEANAFPSDRFACQSHLRLQGHHPEKDLWELPLGEDAATHRTADVITFLEKHAGEIALFLLGGVNYYSGQFFELKKIAAACRRLGITFGVDLAHAIGNVPLKLHDWDIDFATWCSYKYLNSGPGGVSGVFIHERHHHDKHIQRLEGWWGNLESSRFQMGKVFEAATGAEAWQMSNAPVLSMAAHRAALNIFDEAGMPALRRKSKLLSGYLFWLLHEVQKNKTASAFTVITPARAAERGCQVSIRLTRKGKDVFRSLSERGVVADWREPDVIRVAPVPLYNSFTDVYRFVELFQAAL